MTKSVLLAFAILMASMPLARAATPRPDREAENRKAAAEEAAEIEANPKDFGSNFTGKLSLFTKEQKEEYDDSSVYGTFTTDKKMFFVKLVSEKTLDVIKPFDGKTCTVTAKVRNEGKFLLVQKMVMTGAEYIYQKRRGGVGM
jgi:hypothetical protein